MKRIIFPNLPLTLVLVEDPKIGGFTAFFKQLPDIIAEGTTDEEATGNLMNAVHDVFEYQSSITDTPIDPSFRVIQKPLNLCTSPSHH